MNAQSGWYPDPGGVPNLYRYWDGQAWSAATSPHPQAPPPTQGLVQVMQPGGQSAGGQQAYQQGQPTAYANYQVTTARRSPVGWWIGAAALLVVIVVIAVIAVRALSGDGGTVGTGPGTQSSQDVCPTSSAAPSTGQPDANDGRVHGGPISYPRLGAPWNAPVADDRVPFGRDVQKQDVMVEANYDDDHSWVASILVAELMAGDGFYTPEQGSQIVVRCVLGAFYGDNPVTSKVTVNKAITVDGHDAWQVESKLTFDIPNLKTKGELLIVVVVNAGQSSGLYYASIPDTTPHLVQPARDALAKLAVDG